MIPATPGPKTWKMARNRNFAWNFSGISNLATRNSPAGSSQKKQKKEKSQKQSKKKQQRQKQKSNKVRRGSQGGANSGGRGRCRNRR
jgi:uncharacterized protein YjcR